MQQTMAIVLTAPSGMLANELADWLYRRLPPCNVIFPRDATGRDMIAMRNCAVAGARTAPQHITQFLFIDNDIRPSDRSDAIWDADGDVVSVRYRLNAPRAWETDEAVHIGFCKVQRTVIERLPLPWFLQPRTLDGCSLESCECKYFAAKVKDAGFKIGKAVGHAEHDNRKSWCE